MSKSGKRCAYKAPGYSLQCFNRVYAVEDYCTKHLVWHEDCVLSDDEKQRLSSVSR